jgi:hypothetical protein
MTAESAAAAAEVAHWMRLLGKVNRRQRRTHRPGDDDSGYRGRGRARPSVLSTCVA